MVAQTVESACNVGHPGSIPGSGRSSGEGNGNPLQYSCLENPMDGGAWPVTVQGVERVRHITTHTQIQTAKMGKSPFHCVR